MNTLEDELLDHPLSNAAVRMRDALDSLPEDVRRVANESAPGVFQRAEALAAWASGLVDSLDPLLAPRSSLTNCVQQIDQITAYVEQLPNNPAAAPSVLPHIDAAVAAGSQAAMAAGPFPKLTEEIGKRVGRAVSRKATGLARELDEFKSALAQFQVESEAARSQASTEDVQRVEAQSQRLADLAQVIDGEKARVDSFVTTAVTENEAQEKLRNQRLERTVEEQRATFDEALAAMRAEAAAQTNTLSTSGLHAVAAAETKFREIADGLTRQTEELVEHLAGRKAQVDALHEATVQSGLSGAFATEAQSQATAANAWRRGTVVFGVLAVAIATFVALDSPEKLNLEAVVAKLAVSLGFAALATYCARQSGQHRGREASAKALELDLAALAPFLEQLAPEQRTKAIESFVTRWMTTRAVAPDQTIAFGAAALAEAVARLTPGGGPSQPPAA